MRKSKTITISVVLAALALLAQPAWAQADLAAPADTSYFQRFFVDGGPLVWLVLLPISFVTIGLIVQFSLTIRRKKLIPPATLTRVKQLARQGNLPALAGFLQSTDDLLARTLQGGLAELGHGRAIMENAMAEVLEQQTTSLLRRVEWLNIVGNVAPMIGLFGTVWGMVEAFNRIVRANGQPEPDQLAGAISIALVTTLWGMFAAIPALAAYGVIRNRLDAFAAEVALAGENLLRDLKLDNVNSQTLQNEIITPLVTVTEAV